MAPEQAHDSAVDHRADLFSLGSVLYAMCTARPPFDAENPMAVIRRVCEGTPWPVRNLNPAIPEWLAGLIDRLHAKDPAARFQSAAEVAELLNRHLARLDLADPPATVPLRPHVRGRQTPSPGARGVIAAAAVLLAGIGLAGYLYNASVRNVSSDAPPMRAEPARIHRPTPPSAPSHAVVDPERAAAEKLLSLGAVIDGFVGGRPLEVRDAGALPRSGFQATAVHVQNRNLEDADVSHLQAFGGLKELRLQRVPVTDSGLQQLIGIQSLTHLRLDSSRVTDAGLAHLARLTSLRSLYLNCPQVTDQGLERLKPLMHMSALSLDQTQIGDAGLAHLAAFEKLVQLGLRDTPITDAGLAALKGCTKLEVLAIDGTRIGDAGLEHLGALRKLKSVTMKRTQVTAAGIAGLQAALPQCKLVR
jgi:hypothetical protein